VTAEQFSGALAALTRRWQAWAKAPQVDGRPAAHLRFVTATRAAAGPADFDRQWAELVPRWEVIIGGSDWLGFVGFRPGIEGHVHLLCKGRYIEVEKLRREVVAAGWGKAIDVREVRDERRSISYVTKHADQVRRGYLRYGRFLASAATEYHVAEVLRGWLVCAKSA